MTLSRRAFVRAMMTPRVEDPIRVSVRGPMTATDQEAQEGYFQIGRELMIATKPGSPVHDDLTRMVGRAVLVVVEAR